MLQGIVKRKKPTERKIIIKVLLELTNDECFCNIVENSFLTIVKNYALS